MVFTVRSYELWGVSNYLQFGYLFKRLFTRAPKWWTFIRTEINGGFPSQSSSCAESVSMLWRHHHYLLLVRLEVRQIEDQITLPEGCFRQFFRLLCNRHQLLLLTLQARGAKTGIQDIGSPCWPLLGRWCPIFKSSHFNSFETLVDEIFEASLLRPSCAATLIWRDNDDIITLNLGIHFVHSAWIHLSKNYRNTVT